MSLPKYKDLGSLTTLVDIEKEIFILQKSLFDLRIYMQNVELLN